MGDIRTYTAGKFCMLLVSVHRLFFAPIYEFKYLQSTFEETEVVSDPQPAHATIKLEEYVKEGKKALTESRLIEAIDFFSLALERTDGTYPVDPEFMGQALIGRAATNVRLRNYAEGLIDAQAVSSLLPESDQGPTLSGLCYLGLLDLDLAQTHGRGKKRKRRPAAPRQQAERAVRFVSGRGGGDGDTGRAAPRLGSAGPGQGLRRRL